MADNPMQPGFHLRTVSTTQGERRYTVYVPEGSDRSKTFPVILFLHGGFWRELARLLAPLLWPFTVGSLIGAVVLAVLAYPLALAFIKSRKHLQEIIHHKPHS